MNAIRMSAIEEVSSMFQLSWVKYLERCGGGRATKDASGRVNRREQRWDYNMRTRRVIVCYFHACF